MHAQRPAAASRPPPDSDLSGPKPSRPGSADGPSSRPSRPGAAADARPEGPSVGAQSAEFSLPGTEGGRAGELSTGVRDGRAEGRLCPRCGSRYPEDFNVCPRDATPLGWANAPPEDPYLNTTLAETYRVTRVLGEGGMGRVYEAQHTRLQHRRFAIKVLHAEYARYPELVQRFQREAEAASRVRHDNVIEVYDVGRTSEGRPYLVSELLEGDDLGNRLKQEGKLELGVAVHVIRQVCAALEAAHEHSVVHRDMKPENLFLLGEPGRPHVKILDFGISKVDDAGGNNLTRTGMVMGTPAYMAPEQARGEKVDHRADVYAVGAILYRLLTGRTPFDADDAAGAITAVLTADPPRPRAVAPDIPEALELVIERAMAKRPEDRFASMREFSEALAPFDAAPAAPAALALVPGAEGQKPATSGPSSPSRPPALARATREAQLARPSLLGFSLLTAVVLVLGLTAGLADLFALASHTSLSRMTSTALLLGVVAALLTPFALFARHLARAVWGSTTRAIQVAQRLRLAFVVALATYGGLALLVRFLEAVVYLTPEEVSWAGWGALGTLASLLAAASALVALRLSDRR
ncbi:MAG TPA: protein kinase [Polyangiaceae bacterium]|nr:protein kinase [Polyangiaceae bacterium]